MAIRFQCPACAQPIEVDEGWANRAVACPYCRKTVTAPGESTLGDLAAIPMATPISPVGAGAPYPPPAYAPRSNPLAVVAAVLTGVTIGMLLVSGVIFDRHALEFAELEREFRELGGDTSPINAMMEYARKHGNRFPPWLMTFSFLNLGAVVTCLTGLICGLLALRRRARRAWALLSVIACGGIAAWVGLGLVFGGR